MPGYNRAGPLGNGPMTGGGMGYCNFPKADYSQAECGRGPEFQRGFRGRSGFAGPGFRGGKWARRQHVVKDEVSREQSGTVEMLKAGAGSIKTELETINRRITNLENADD